MLSIVSKLRKELAGQLSGRILDVGCGQGIFSPFLRRGGNQVIHVDVDAGELRKAGDTGVLASCADLPFPEGCFDAVWACAVIEHVAEDTIPELIRVTRDGGRVIAVTPNRRSPWDPLKRLVGLKTWYENRGHVRLYSSEELAPFGQVHGEVVFVPLPGARRFFWNHPNVGHALILDIRVTPELRRRMAREYPRVFRKAFPKAVKVVLSAAPSGP